MRPAARRWTPLRKHLHHWELRELEPASYTKSRSAVSYSRQWPFMLPSVDSLQVDCPKSQKLARPARAPVARPAQVAVARPSQPRQLGTSGLLPRMLSLPTQQLSPRYNCPNAGPADAQPQPRSAASGGSCGPLCTLPSRHSRPLRRSVMFHARRWRRLPPRLHRLRYVPRRLSVRPTS